MIFSRLVFERHLFLCCQICLLCFGADVRLSVMVSYLPQEASYVNTQDNMGLMVNSLVVPVVDLKKERMK